MEVWEGRRIEVFVTLKKIKPTSEFGYFCFVNITDEE